MMYVAKKPLYWSVLENWSSWGECSAIVTETCKISSVKHFLCMVWKKEASPITPSYHILWS